MIASEKDGRGAEKHRGRSAFMDPDAAVRGAMARLLELGGGVAQSRFAAIGGTRLHYLDHGSGDTTLFLHGAGGGAANWYPFLGRRGFQRTVAVDLPGFGLSDSIEPRAPLGRQVADLIFQFLNQVDVVPARIIGTSFGGLVAAHLARKIEPRSLVLIDPAGLWRRSSIYLKIACMPFFQRLALKQTRRGARWALRHILTSGRLPAAHENGIAEYLYASALRTDMQKLARGYALFGGWHGQTEVLTADDTAALAPRTLLIYGERDRFLPPSSKGMRALLACGAHVRMIPGVGHSPNWEAPDEVMMLMEEFWERVEG